MQKSCGGKQVEEFLETEEEMLHFDWPIYFGVIRLSRGTGHKEDDIWDRAKTYFLLIFCLVVNVPTEKKINIK